MALKRVGKEIASTAYWKESQAPLERSRRRLWSLPLLLTASAPGVRFFRGRITGPHVPLSTLRRHPRRRLRMTRGGVAR